MNLFINVQASRILFRVLIALWVVFTVSFVLFVISQYSLLTSSILLLVAISGFAPCALWQQKRLNNLNQGVLQLQFVDGCWYLVMQSEAAVIEKHSIELGNDNAVWPWWIKLNYKLEQGEDEQSLRQLLICRDAVSEADFRHLSRVLSFYRNEEPEELKPH
ncbi:MAG: hypothetical protein OQJ95_02830 [Kangiella sp.]|nr:hypothetical protein [Kangiella sp.]